MYLIDDSIENAKLSEDAFDTIQRLCEQKKTDVTKQDELNKNTLTLMKYNMFDEYDSTSFMEKINYDINYFNVLFRKLPNDNSIELKEHLSSLIKNVNNVYSMINISPKTFGFYNYENNHTIDIDNSQSILEEQAEEDINNFIKSKYYNLTKEEKNKKYGNLVTEMVKNNIADSVDIALSVENAQKTVIIQELLKEICFPNKINHYINSLFLSESYTEMFEIDAIKNELDIIDSTILSLSKIICKHI